MEPRKYISLISGLLRVSIATNLEKISGLWLSTRYMPIWVIAAVWRQNAFPILQHMPCLLSIYSCNTKSSSKARFNSNIATYRLPITFALALQSVTQIMRMIVAYCIQNLKFHDNTKYMLFAKEIRFEIGLFLHCNDTTWGWIVWFIEMKRSA